MIQEIKGEKTLPKIRKVEKKIQAIGKSELTSDHNLEDWSLAADELKPGDTVLLLNLGTTAILLEATKGKKKVQVRMGNINTTVETSSIRGNPQQENKSNNLDTNLVNQFFQKLFLTFFLLSFY